MDYRAPIEMNLFSSNLKIVLGYIIRDPRDCVCVGHYFAEIDSYVLQEISPRYYLMVPLIEYLDDNPVEELQVCI